MHQRRWYKEFRAAQAMPNAMQIEDSYKLLDSIRRTHLNFFEKICLMFLWFLCPRLYVFNGKFFDLLDQMRLENEDSQYEVAYLKARVCELENNLRQSKEMKKRYDDLRQRMAALNVTLAMRY
jgi:hypothetical protein